jgi:bifunctional UDP-N-acetylglucosamine pyrophosphorylase/glucosamine-1-phosphate N-acetyltransferase
VVVSGQEVIDELADIAPEASAVLQNSPLGTGHATRIALESAPELTGPVLILPGDSPLLRPETLRQLLDQHARSDAAATVLTARPPDPTGYGRIVRTPTGHLRAIVEERDADAATRHIDEVATSVYVFDAATLRGLLPRVNRSNSQHEEYLTDVIEMLVTDGCEVETWQAADPQETLGINDRVQLAAARRTMRDRLLEHWMRAGVTVTDPATTWLGVNVQLAPDVTIHQHTQLHGHTRIDIGATVGPNCTLRDTTVGEGATVTYAVCEGAEIGPGATVGPFTYLRPGARLGRGAKAGAYVEIKESTVGDESKVPHLSYVGDATIGERTNIGAATVFVNFDGEEKHRTLVGDDVRIGSDTMLVAPVTVGDGAYTAAGSVIDQDVPAGALGVGRARQRNIVGWVFRRRAGTRSAKAAEAAQREEGAGS